MLGISACSTARFLRTVVSAFDRLTDIDDDDPEATFNTLADRLERLLNDTIGDTPRVDVLTNDINGPDSGRSELIVEIEKDWFFDEASSFAIDLAEIFQSEETAGDAIESILRTVLPVPGQGEFEIGVGLSLKLGVGIEVVKQPDASFALYPFITGSSGLYASFETSASFTLPVSIGPLTA